MAGTSANSSAEATAAVDAYLRTQCAAILAGEADLRESTTSVHATRVAIRRLRSTLRVFGSAFEPAVLGLDPELAWYAGLLGTVRDYDVQRARLAEAVAALPGELVLGSVTQDLDDDLRAELRRHHEHAVEALGSERYGALRSAVARLAAEPSYASLPTKDVLSRQAKLARRKATRRLASALDADDADALHRARKSAKRARYAAELLEPIHPGAAKQVRRFKAIQDVLGAYQDSIMASQLLLRLGGPTGSLPGHNGFTYGLLYAEQLEAARLARQAAGRL